MRESGVIDLYFNGIHRGTFFDEDFTFFQKAFLGISGTNGQTLNVTYTTFNYGTDYVSEPGTMVAFGSGLLGIAGFVIRRKK
ncbi:MAG: PEP-CTERM sorting domain-containing protein [Armatimonadota bacterium]